MTRSRILLTLLTGLYLTAGSVARADLDAETATLLRAAIDGEHRSPENRARDAYRKPYETLEFLGLDSDMTVVEVWPGAGWYSEILAPVLKDSGTFYAAQFSPNGPYGYQRRGLGAFLSKLGSKPDLYRQLIVTELDLPYSLRIAPPGSADMMLTFQAMYDALKPGGILGVVDHEWDDPATEDPNSENGYISLERTIALAESAGFEVVGTSPVLKNPKDTKDHPSGVWTLPPSLALGDKDRAKYEAIGESDRFLLKLVKPAGA